MLKKYFTYVPLWLCIMVNALLGIPASGLFLAALVYTFGLFNPPSDTERIQGILMFAGLIVGVIGANAIAFAVCRRLGNESREAPDKKKVIIRLLIATGVFILIGGSFFLFPDLWLLFNGWWF